MLLLLLTLLLLIVLGIGSLMAAMSLHGFGFVLRCVIAERFAIQNQFESMTGLSLFAALVGSVLMVVKRQWLFGAAAALCLALIVLLLPRWSVIAGNLEKPPTSHDKS